MRTLALPLLLALSAAACGGEPSTDAAVDAPGPSCTTPTPFEAATGEGSAEPLGAAASEARAGRIEAAELPADPARLATWREGDFVLANDRVALLVSEADTPREVYDPYGGRIVGVARVEAGALVEPADFSLLILGVGRFLLATDSVGVRSDGSDGGPAVIRASGPLAPIEALADLLDALLPGDFAGLPGAIDYELAPGSDAVDVYVSVRAGPQALRAQLGVMQAFFQEYRMPPWSPGAGFGEASSLRYLAFTDDDATSYAWMPPEGTLGSLLSQAGIDIFTSPRLSVEPCGEARVHVARMVIGGPGLMPLLGAVAALEGTASAPISGFVREADGSPAPDARVHVTTADGEHLGRAWPAPDGSFSFDADARGAQLWAWRAGQDPVGPVAAGEGAELTMPAFATIDVTATALDGAPLPSRVEVAPVAAPAAPPDSWGEVPAGRGRSHVAFPTDGRATLRVAPGAHRVFVSHGPEYERYEADVDVAAGETSTHAVTLERVVETSGVMCADYHIHTHRSVDSSDTGALKVAGLVADGLEIAVRSEHEWVTSFSPIVEELGLTAHVLPLTGLELTTFTFGHFGVFPLMPDERPGGGAVGWYGRLAPEVFDVVRARPEQPALIINHPRAGGVRQGYFSVAGYDPVTGTVARPELWDEGFSVVEAFNSTDFERNREGTVRDWFSLLAAGRRVFVVGSSDSHRILENPVGYPRTCLHVGVDEVSALTADAVRDATVAGRSYVSGGIHLEVVGPGGVGPGEDAAGAGASATLDVVVRAAPRIDVTRLEVIVDGQTVETIPITPDDTDPLEPSVRLRAPVQVDVASSGSWVVLHAAGDDGYGNHDLRPFAVSNPMFLTR